MVSLEADLCCSVDPPRADALASPPKRLRGPIARGLDTDTKNPIEPEGGEFGAGLIRQAAVITRGAAIGYDTWIDRPMLEQVRDAINEAERGTKARFAHPGLSGDGLGKALGRWRSARTVGGLVTRADLHFFKSAHETPDGDLAQYVMALGREDPAAFGASIAYEPDGMAEERFRLDNTDDEGRFKSPDRLNIDGLPHERLAELVAADVVDEPAANPGGLFHRGGNWLTELEQAIDYVLKMSDDKPRGQLFGVDPDRARAFMSRYLEQRDLAVYPAEHRLAGMHRVSLALRRGVRQERNRRHNVSKD